MQVRSVGHTGVANGADYFTGADRCSGLGKHGGQVSIEGVNIRVVPQHVQFNHHNVSVEIRLDAKEGVQVRAAIKNGAGSNCNHGLALGSSVITAVMRRQGAIPCHAVAIVGG